MQGGQPMFGSCILINDQSCIIVNNRPEHLLIHLLPVPSRTPVGKSFIPWTLFLTRMSWIPGRIHVHDMEQCL